MSLSFYKAVSLFLSSKYYYNIKKAMQRLHGASKDCWKHGWTCCLVFRCWSRGLSGQVTRGCGLYLQYADQMTELEPVVEFRDQQILCLPRKSKFKLKIFCLKLYKWVLKFKVVRNSIRMNNWYRILIFFPLGKKCAGVKIGLLPSAYLDIIHQKLGFIVIFT